MVVSYWASLIDTIVNFFYYSTINKVRVATSKERLRKNSLTPYISRVSLWLIGKYYVNLKTFPERCADRYPEPKYI